MNKTPNSTKKKSFELDYLRLIANIKAKQVFVDLPVHLQPLDSMSLETLEFLQGIVSNRQKRTAYIKKLNLLAKKIIPVVSTYYNKTGEKGSITLQEKDLRPVFNVIAFRTFMKTFKQDISQIEPLLKETDFIIMDWEDEELDLKDDDQKEIVDYLKNLKCTIIVHRNSFNCKISNVGLQHGEIVEAINNCLLNKYKQFAGTSFSDYAGIKKDNLSGAPIVSPGFVFYDAVENEFYGFRYKYGGHKKGDVSPDLSEFETTIIPAVISSDAIDRMKNNSLDYLGTENVGWKIIQDIHDGREPGRSPAKFKRIAMEHYLHCIKIKIAGGLLN